MSRHSIQTSLLARSESLDGFSKSQVLLALLVVFPLGLIGVGMVLNALLLQVHQPKISSPELSVQTPSSDAERQANASISPLARAPHQDRSEDQSVIELGVSVTGLPMRLLTSSIERWDPPYRRFSYQLGDSQVQAMADCNDWSWTSYPERQINRPQSAATERMMRLVCKSTPNLSSLPSEASPSGSFPGVALVFDPPSNVRSAPGGAFLCTIKKRLSVPVGQPQGEWYPTSACGEVGYIHSSQLRF